MQRIEMLIHQIEQFPDGRVQAVTRELVQALLDVHGAGLARILEAVARSGGAGQSLLDALAGDELVTGLLLLHGLHPLDLETRVRRALDQVRPTLNSRGGNVELLAVEGGVVRVRLEGAGEDRELATTFQQLIEQAICEQAPDATALEIEGSSRSLRVSLPLVPGTPG
jgi:Fe-S cluster biogenesis protein NfuA